jgi:hypothetical protein
MPAAKHADMWMVVHDGAFRVAGLSDGPARGKA